MQAQFSALEQRIKEGAASLSPGGANAPLPDIVNTRRTPMSRQQLVERYLQTVGDNPDVDANKLREKEEPRMLARERLDLELPWGPIPEPAGPQSGGQSRRAVGSEQDESPWQPPASQWQHLYTTTSTLIYQDAANLQSFYNELSRHTCSDNQCTSRNDVHLDWTGPRPNEAAEPFTYPVLIDNALRTFIPEGFHAAASRLHAVSIAAPFPFMHSAPPRNRDAVPVMATGSECEHIKPYQPASCTTFSAGDQVAQIDKFFSDNRAQGKAPGAVFVDGPVIERWARESRIKGTTALAIRPDIDVVYGLIGGAGGFLLILSSYCCWLSRSAITPCPGAVARRVRAGWEKCKSAVGVLWNLRSRQPLAPPVISARSSAKNTTEDYAEESSIVIEDSDSGSTYLGDFSSSDSGSGTTGKSRSNDSTRSDSSRTDS